jgi:hypothetical protein
MWLYAVFVIIQGIISRIASGGGAIVGLLSFIPVLIFLPVVVFNWLGSKVFTLLNMAISRRAEYRADMFAASLGYKTDMIQALEIIDSLTVTDNSFLAKLMSTHPAPMQRIGALEDGEIQHKSIGGLAIATPFADNSAITVTASSEFIRLASIISIVGSLWCGYTVYDYYANSKMTKSNVLTDNNSSTSMKKAHLKSHRVVN